MITVIKIGYWYVTGNAYDPLFLCIYIYIDVSYLSTLSTYPSFDLSIHACIHPSIHPYAYICAHVADNAFVRECADNECMPHCPTLWTGHNIKKTAITAAMHVSVLRWGHQWSLTPWPFSRSTCCLLRKAWGFCTVFSWLRADLIEKKRFPLRSWLAWPVTLPKGHGKPGISDDKIALAISMAICRA